ETRGQNVHVVFQNDALGGTFIDNGLARDAQLFGQRMHSCLRIRQAKLLSLTNPHPRERELPNPSLSLPAMRSSRPCRPTSKPSPPHRARRTAARRLFHHASLLRQPTPRRRVRNLPRPWRARRTARLRRTHPRRLPPAGPMPQPQPPRRARLSPSRPPL